MTVSLEANPRALRNIDTTGPGDAHETGVEGACVSHASVVQIEEAAPLSPIVIEELVDRPARGWRWRSASLAIRIAHPGSGSPSSRGFPTGGSTVRRRGGALLKSDGRPHVRGKTIEG